MAYNYIRYFVDVSLMKMDKKEKAENRPLPGAALVNACMDCMFWYQCKRGNIDCHIKARQGKNAIAGA